MQLSMEFKFAAAHQLPRHPGKCRDLHGHNYRLVVTLGGRPDPESGMIIDFADLSGIVQEQVLDLCDHRNFNDLVENPTAENIAAWAWGRLKPRLPGLAELRLYELDDAWVIYRGPDAS